MSFRVRCTHVTAALWATTNKFTFHFPGDSAVVHFKGTVVVQVWLVQAGALFVKRCVSCLLCSWNQRGNTESICLWREGTAVVHRQGIESGKAVPPPPPPLSNRSESRRRLCTMERNMRQNGVFTFRHRRSVGARVWGRQFSKYSHGYCEDAKSSPVLTLIWLTLKDVLVSKHSSSAEKRERACLVSPPVGGGVVSSENCLEEKLLLLLRECQKWARSTPPLHHKEKSVCALHWMFYFNKSLSVIWIQLQRHCNVRLQSAPLFQ